MKKKLFIWMYTHYPDHNTTCGLSEDGVMVFTTNHNKDNDYIKMLKDKEMYTDDYDVHIIDQKILEDHMYHGEPRDTLPLDFRAAWDIYKMGPVANAQ